MQAKENKKIRVDLLERLLTGGAIVVHKLDVQLN